LVAQHATQDLSTGTLGNHIDKANTALQPLVASLVVLNMFLDRFGGGFVGAGGS
jgi:hypothetical protein